MKFKLDWFSLLQLVLFSSSSYLGPVSKMLSGQPPLLPPSLLDITPPSYLPLIHSFTAQILSWGSLDGLTPLKLVV